MRECKEDSTKGSARIMPTNYKGDVLVQAWVDARKLAALSVWLDEGGYVTRHLSDLVTITIDEVVSKLIDAEMVEKIEFTDEARNLLIAKYRAQLNPGGRGKRNMLHNLHLDELRRSRFKNEVNEVPVLRQGQRVSREEMKELMKTYEKIAKEDREKKFKEQADKQKEEAMKSKYFKEDKAIIDVEENIRRMKEYDKKLKDMP